MRKNIHWVVVISLMIWSCQPKPKAADLLKNLVVNTQYDQTVNFGSYKTYYLPLDTLSYFNNTDNVASDTLQCVACASPNNNALGAYAHLITTELQLKLNAAGYTKVASIKQNPDLKVYVFIVDNFNTYQTYSYNPYGYSYGYGYGYGSYTPTYSTSEQTDLYIEIFDLNPAHYYQGHPRLVWLCDIGDIAANPNSFDLTTGAIDRAFAQSTYIKKQ